MTGRIIITNLPFTFSQESFRKFFSKYGKLSEGYIALDSDGKSRGFGFITFKNSEDIQKILTDDIVIVIEDRPIRCIKEEINSIK